MAILSVDALSDALKDGKHPVVVSTIDWNSIAEVQDFSDDDLMLSVEAGMTFGMLDDFLLANDLTLGLTYPRDARLVDLLAYDMPAPEVGRRGYLREHVIGLEAVMGDGRVVAYGGNVLKNVTGYDLTALLCGSRHQFGIITAVTFKLRVPAKAQRALTWSLSTLDEALGLCERWHPLAQQFNAIKAVEIKRQANATWHITVAVQGDPSVVEHVSQALAAVWEPPQDNTQGLAPVDLHLSTPTLTVIITTPAHEWTAMGKQIMGVDVPASSIHGLRLAGTWVVSWHNDANDAYPSANTLEALASHVQAQHGVMCVPMAPIALQDMARQINAPKDPIHQALYGELKKRFDPKHRL